MASDYEWDLPLFDSGGSDWTDTNNYDLESSGSGSDWTDTNNYDLGSDDWYVDSTGGSDDSDTSVFSDIWGWVTSDQGVSVLGGAASGALKLWMANQANEMRKSSGGGGGGGSNAAELYDARVKKHNASINQPMDMGITRLVRK